MQELSPVAVKLGSDAMRRDYLIHFNSLDSVPGLMKWAGMKTGKCILITDSNVHSHFGDPLVLALSEAEWEPITVVLPAGEETKSIRYLEQIYDEVLPKGIERKTPLLALGGGVIGDLAGFAAATLLRGLPLIQLPTTLMSQVDSSIGGKTGINHATGKNLIGAFLQPAFVCSDLATLERLPEREWTSGLAEVVKHALIADPGLFEFLQTNWSKILKRDSRAVGFMVQRSAAIKAKVVSEDEFEGGARATLNFGHTFGHALERATGYGHFSHGEAVAIGMLAGLRLSQTVRESLRVHDAVELVQRIPTPPIPDSLDLNQLVAAMHLDKKVKDGKLRCVILDSVGKALITDIVRDETLIDAWEFAKEMTNSG